MTRECVAVVGVTGNQGCAGHTASGKFGMAIATMLAELDYETKRHHLTVENVATNHNVPLELVQQTKSSFRFLVR